METRIIPSLLLDCGKLFKGIQYKNHTYVGCPINAVKIFTEKEVDEILIADKSARKNGINYEKLYEIVSESFVPITYSGGVQNLQEIKQLIELGVEKVVITSEFILNPEFLRKATNKFGSSTIVAGIDLKYDLFKRKKAYILNGKKKTKYSLNELLALAEDVGAGEILVTDIDREGTLSGINYEILSTVDQNVNVPYIVQGGVKSYEEIKLLKQKKYSGIGVSTRFTYQGKLRAVLINYPK